MQNSDTTTAGENPCQACGACCGYSQNWPRFTTEDDAQLDLIPEKFVNERLSGMRCEGDRCLGAVRKDRRGNAVRYLCGAARSVPNLHARRPRMRDGTAQAWAAGAGLMSFRP